MKGVLMLRKIAASSFLRDFIFDDKNGLSTRYPSGNKSSDRQPSGTIPFRRTLLNSSSLITSLALGLVVAMPANVARAQSTIPTLAGGTGGGGSGAQASTGVGTNGTGLGYNGGTGGGAGSVGGAGGNAGAGGTTVPNSGGTGGSAGGGAGGNGADYIAIGGGYGGGGGGGAHASAGTTLPGGSNRTGGAGGKGGTGGDPTVDNHNGGGGGGGGGGGFGAVVEANGALGTLTIGLTGGAGGAGGNTTAYGYSYAGAGGTGGGGLYLSSTQNTSLTISGIVTGGVGGAGGTTQNQFAIVNGGAGGSAIYAGNSAGITTLTLTGAAQAIGGSGGAGSSAVYAGAAGPGIAGENLNIILAAGSTVSAGQTSNISSPRNAIQFVAGTNSLELQGNGGTSGRTYAAITGNVVGGGTTALKLTGAGGTFNVGLLDPSQGFSGFTGVTVNSTGRWIVSGTQAEAAPWTVAAGTLSNSLTGASSATLSGNTTIANGAHLSAQAVSGSSAFTINGDLLLNATSALDVTLGAPTSTALVTVNGNLALNGTLKIADAGTMAQGTYTLIGYAGSYSGAGLTISTDSDPDFRYAISTSTANLVTLAVTVNGLYWNGTTTSGSPVVVVGGSGTWTAAPGVTNWITPDLTTYVASTPSMPALFRGTAGTVSVSTTAGAVSAEGLKFETTGYTLVAAAVGDTLGLAITSGVPRVNVVGDATIATVALPLTGTQGLEKTGTGKLVLTGTNTYTGNTTISAGTLQLGNGTTTGTVVGNITNNAALAFNPTGLTAAYAGVISGTGTVEKAGAGWQTLYGNNTYSGVTTVSGGLLLVSGNNALGSTAGGTIVSSGATLGLYGTSISIAEPLTLSGFGAGNLGALASFRGNSFWTGINTIDGAITLAADASIVNSGGAGDVLNLTGTITGDGKSLYLGSSTGAINTVSGKINTGTGSVGIASGTWKFSNANGYTGSTVIAAGAKLILESPNGNAIPGDIANSGTLALIGEDLNGTISGSGNIEVGSSSGFTSNNINGANTYTGNTTIIGGHLTINNFRSLGSAAGGTTVSSGGSLIIGLPNGNSSIDEPLTISGLGYYAGNDAAVTIQSGTVTYTGSITLAESARINVSDAATVEFKGSIIGSGKTLSLNANSTATNKRTISGVIALGSGGVAIRGGDWVFSAQNTYTGVTTIGGEGTPAKLSVTGSLAGGAEVYKNGTLAGSGNVAGAIVKSGGKVAPGNSPGTLTVNGNLSMESGSVYEADVEPSGAHDLLLVNGNVSLSSGASVHLITQPGTYSTTSTLTILSASGTISGSFGTVISDSPFLIPTLSEDGQNIFLTITSRSFDSLAQTPNQFAVAGAAQALGAGNPVFDAIMYVPADAVPQAFDQLSGEIYPSINTVIQQQSAYLRDAVGARLRQSVTGPTATALSYAAKAQGPEAAQLAEGLTPTLWMQGFGGWGDTSGNGNAASISNTIGGVIAGLDVAVTDNVRAGLVGGFSRSSFDVDARNSSGDMDNYDIGVYAGGQFGAVALRGGASYSWHDVSVNRTIAFPGFAGLTEGDYTVGTTQLFGEVAYDFTVGAFEFEPFAGLAYLHLSGETFTETGTQTSGAALGVSLASQDTLYSTLGIRAATSVTVGGYALTPSVALGWQHAFGDTVSVASMLFQGGAAPFQVTGVPIAEDTLLLGAGLAYDISDRASLQVNYTGQLAGDASQNALTAQFSLRF